MKVLKKPKWTSEYLPWEEKNKFIQRKYKANKGYELLQGKGTVQGHLIEGCFEVLDTRNLKSAFHMVL